MSLAETSNAPIRLADGSWIDPTDGSVIGEKKAKQRYVEVPNGAEAQRMVARARRSVAELPLPTGQMNVIGLVVLYTMWGMSDDDIALASGSLSLEQVKNIKTLNAYNTMFDDIMSGVLEHETSNIRNFFQQKAMESAQKVVDIASNGNGTLALTAARDVLDRAGHRPADVVEHHHRMENALRIEVVRREEVELPSIDTTWKDISDGNGT